MSVTLVFNGGLFSVMPGVVQPKKIDVFMTACTIEPVGGDVPEELEGAPRIDFETKAAFEMSRFHLRDVAHLIPVNYGGFNHIVSFDGGTVYHRGLTPRDEQVTPVATAKADDLEDPENLKALQTIYQNFLDFEQEDERGEYLKRLLKVFFANKDAQDLRLWTPGYETVVDLGEEVNVVCNGNWKKELLSGNIEIRFGVQKGTTIPHFPHNNPHVLEQPPTI